MLSLIWARVQITRDDAERTIASPDRVTPGRAGRAIYQRVYQDEALGQTMLLRVILEETELERVVVTLYKTSKLQKYG